MHRLRKQLLISLGFSCVALGVVGALVPLMPSTLFWLLAAGFFARSSPAFRERLLTHPWVGSSVRSLSEQRALSVLAKRRAIGGLWGSLMFSGLIVFLTVSPAWVMPIWFILILVGTGVSCLILFWLRTLPARSFPQALGMSDGAVLNVRSEVRQEGTARETAASTPVRKGPLSSAA